MNYKGLLFFVIIALGLNSCFDPSKPNYQYFPNMYESIGYETYAESDAFANGIEAQIPDEGSIMRGWEPYDYPNTNEGYEAAKVELMSPLRASGYNLANGKPIKLMSFISVIEKILNKKAKKKYIELQDGDVEKTYANVKKFKSHYKLKKPDNLKYGILKFITWYKKYYKK